VFGGLNLSKLTPVREVLLEEMTRQSIQGIDIRKQIKKELRLEQVEVNNGKQQIQSSLNQLERTSNSIQLLDQQLNNTSSFNSKTSRQIRS